MDAPQDLEEVCDKLKVYFEDAPKTLAEITEDFKRGVTSADLEKALHSLVENGVLVCNEMYSTDCKLYWKSVSLQRMQTPQRPTNTVTGTPSLHRPLLNTALRKPTPRARQPFKSPAITHTPDTAVSPHRSTKYTLTPHTSSRTNKTPAAVEAEIQELKTELEKVEKEIAELSESYSVDELEGHIAALHRYNEVKDAGQILLGKLAEVEGTTTASLYERYGLELDS